MRKIGIIGGSGVEDPELMQGFKQKTLKTPYGPALCNIGEMFGNQVVFVSRHGADHSVPPNKVNYRANIWALKKLGTQEIFATTAVGSLNPKYTAGHFVVCSDILDFTKSRISTFYDTPERGVVHVDFTHPYCAKLRAKVIACLKELGITYHKQGVYVCTDGPRFETAAEIKAYALLGGDLVGMTQMPEAILAREAEMCYTNVSIVTNMAAGISKNPLSHAEVLEAMEVSKKNMQALLQAFIAYEEKSPAKDIKVGKSKKKKKSKAAEQIEVTSDILQELVDVANGAEQVPVVEEQYDCSCLHALKDFGGFKL